MRRFYVKAIRENAELIKDLLENGAQYGDIVRLVLNCEDRPVAATNAVSRHFPGYGRDNRVRHKTPLGLSRDQILKILGVYKKNTFKKTMKKTGLSHSSLTRILTYSRMYLLMGSKCGRQLTPWTLGELHLVLKSIGRMSLPEIAEKLKRGRGPDAYKCIIIKLSTMGICSREYRGFSYHRYLAFFGHGPPRRRKFVNHFKAKRKGLHARWEWPILIDYFDRGIVGGGHRWVRTMFVIMDEITKWVERCEGKFDPYEYHQRRT